MSTVAPILEIHDLQKTYGRSGLLGRFTSRAAPPALNHVSLSLAGDGGQVLAVVGESGSGKTTLARIILRCSRPTPEAFASPGKRWSAVKAGRSTIGACANWCNRFFKIRSMPSACTFRSTNT